MATDYMDSKEGTSRLTGSSQQKSASTTVSETRQASGDTSEAQQAPFKARRPMRSTAMLAGGRYGASKMNCPTNQLKHIALDENGTFMSDFDPERSKREMRKLNRKIHKENKKQNQMYDEAGRLLENSFDICDCLQENCPGCHFPCPKCGSEKCGAECRCERRWIYEQIEIEGTTVKFNWTATNLG